MSTETETPVPKIDRRTKKGKAAVSSSIDKSAYGIPWNVWSDPKGGSIDMPTQVGQTSTEDDGVTPKTIYKTRMVPEWAHSIRLPVGLTEPKVVVAAVENLAVAVAAAAEMRERIAVAGKEIAEAQAADKQALNDILRLDPYAMFGADDGTVFEPPHANEDKARARLANAERLVAVADAQATVAYGTVVGAIDVVSPTWRADLAKEIEISRNILAGKVYALEVQAEALKSTVGLYEMLTRMSTGTDRRPAVAPDPLPTLKPLTDSIAVLGPFVRDRLGAIIDAEGVSKKKTSEPEPSEPDNEGSAA